MRDALPALDEEGRAGIVIALAGDALGFLGRRAAVLGGRAHLVMVDHPGPGMTRLRILRAGPGDTAIGEPGGFPDRAVTQDAAIDLLIEDITVGSAVRCHTDRAGTVISYLTDAIQPVPA